MWWPYICLCGHRLHVFHTTQVYSSYNFLGDARDYVSHIIISIVTVENLVVSHDDLFETAYLMPLCCYYAAWFTHNERGKEAYTKKAKKLYRKNASIWIWLIANCYCLISTWIWLTPNCYWLMPKFVRLILNCKWSIPNKIWKFLN